MQLPFLNSYRSGQKVFTYYRRKGFQVRLSGEIGTADFFRSYQEAHASFEKLHKATGPAPAPQTLGALAALYRASPEWRGLSLGSRKDYKKGLSFLDDHYAKGPVRTLERQHIRAIRDHASTKKVKGEVVEVPSRANKVVTMLSILLNYAVELGWRSDNPAAGFPKLDTKGGGYRAWSDAEVVQFLTWAADKPAWLRAFRIALYTGQRGQDQVKMTWASYDGEMISLIQLKTGIEVWVPAHEVLRAELDAAKEAVDQDHPGLTEAQRQDMPIMLSNGKAWVLNSFQKAAGVAIREAGLSGVVWHGLRATAATRLAEAGCTERQIMAVTGHTTPQMVERYTKNASRKVMAREAMTKLGNKD